MKQEGAFLGALRDEVGKVIIGQQEMVDRIIMGSANRRSRIARRSSWISKNVNY